MVQLGLLVIAALVIWPAVVFGRKYLMTQNGYDRASSLMKADIEGTAALPGLRPGSTPIWKLHPVGSYAYGTVVVFNGFSANAIASAQQAEYLFNAGFNVYAGNLPGFAQNSEYWVSATLRDTAGYAPARSALLRDKRIQNAIRLFTSTFQSFEEVSQRLNGTKLVPVVREIIQRELPVNIREGVLAAFDLLSPFRSANGADFSRSINKYFYSEHLEYDAAISALSKVQPLPGPLYMVGFSFGGPNVVNVAARSRSVERAVLLAPFLGNLGATSDLTYMFNIAGALDLFKYQFFGQTISPSSSTAGNIFTQLVVRDEVLRAARESTQVLCIFALDDVTIDVVRTQEVCDSKLGGRSLMYPKNLGLNHFITPETGSKYSNAMMQQIVSFFLNGTATQNGLLKLNANTTL